MECRYIDEENYRKRMISLCVRSVLPGLPKKRIDRAVLLKSLIQRFRSDVEYGEKEVNLIIATWLDEVTPKMKSDFVTLRRLLVDEGVLQRDAQGSSYQLKTSDLRDFEFSEKINPREIESELGNVREDILRRRREFLDEST
ncbi:DUF2087 domain-containing protein [bacterium]|nr:DUF2087 domain-containing protein [bacterium]